MDNLQNFAPLILTHGRPDRVFTVESLRAAGYSGPFYLVVDNEDETVDEYIERYGEDKVVIFDKAAIAERMDEADNFKGRNTVVYARNASFDIAKDLGLDYFLQLDDDYTTFSFRYSDGKKLCQGGITNLNYIFSLMVDYLEKTGALTVAFAQGGDFIGGAESGNWRQGCLRKAMNTFFCKTDRRFWFLGRLNEDVNTYTTLGKRGGLFLTIVDVMINQKETQGQAGGMTEFYDKYGTYYKSFVPVMMNPSGVRVGMMGNKDMRVHHKILWSKQVPKILNERYKKGSGR